MPIFENSHLTSEFSEYDTAVPFRWVNIFETNEGATGEAIPSRPNDLETNVIAPFWQVTKLQKQPFTNVLQNRCS